MPNKDIQPKYFDNAKFVCTTCDNVMEIGSTKAEEIRIDVCSNCHAFYTGNQLFSNTAGRVEQFKAKFAKKDEINSKKNKN
ncbi:50S ribosomal protein L31 [Williamsoniiplasma luminosum]|uniref:50S ribosomal protein L31 n=1 Tax=Williamsoniiplasma luminosum TaxID=214888 RepID=A0A2K8NSZ4_9MOLU|nr:50S ribosomal protein L31 [Williamsoniiplasma luminosum]ATZ16965.1 50S ribosomal protein L31 [Williamsoniiplasma luminosum]AVP49634.1 MAG: 50S ribosomal protein L31 [Williamsoniiplasma luminosum]